MIRTLVTFVIFLFVISPTYGHTRAAIGESPSLLCTRAIAETTQLGSTLPPHLLSAIALVESGRLDPRTHSWQPWPWTINAGGKGYFFRSKADAIMAVRWLQARGVYSIDVGCMQVNLQQHPHAFRSLDAAFDPRTNTRYALQFLTALYATTGTWAKAAQWYHSATPTIGIPYAQKVLALLGGTFVLTPAERAEQARKLKRKALAMAWAATIEK
jgi:hypothetical protein